MINTSVDECRNSRQGKDLFEEKLPALCRTGFLRAASPADADFLYHPACLVDAFFRLRGRGSRELRVIESAVMREVEATLRAAVKRTPIIVNSLRCYTARPAAFTLGLVREEIPYGFPVLWGGHQVLRFCAEAFPACSIKRSRSTFHTAQRRLGSCLLASAVAQFRQARESALSGWRGNRPPAVSRDRGAQTHAQRKARGH